MLRHALWLGALFQAGIALGFALVAPLWQIGAAADALLPPHYALTLGALGASALALYALGALTRTGGERGARATLALLALLLPGLDLELCLRPFAPPAQAKTRLFVGDAKLGWRLRPGARPNGAATR